MTTAAVRARVTSFAPQFLVDDLERSIGREKRRSDFRLGAVESKHTWRLSVRNPAGRASFVERCCRLDTVGRKRSQQTASEHPACDRHTAFIQRALRCSVSAPCAGR